MKVLVVYYSMYGHVHKMAEAVAEGAKSAGGVDAELRRVPETLHDDVLAKMGALEAKKGQAGVQVADVDELAKADALVFGTPTRFGNMCAQMRQFLDATGKLWLTGALPQADRPGHQFGHRAVTRRPGLAQSSIIKQGHSVVSRTM